MSHHKKWQGYYVILSEILSVRPAVSVSIICVPSLTDTVQDIFMKLHTNVKHYERTCRTHELLLWFVYFLNCCPLNIAISAMYLCLFCKLKNV